MEVYKGVSYFHESPYLKLSPAQTYTPPPTVQKEKKFRMRAYNYSNSNAIFVKPVKKEELENVVKSSHICNKFGQATLNTYRSFDNDDPAHPHRSTVGHLPSTKSARLHYDEVSQLNGRFQPMIISIAVDTCLTPRPIWAAAEFCQVITTLDRDLLLKWNLAGMAA